ncbi:hypothetical protein ACFL27_25445, partial [candidate division CSSED10-310 bacterium]
ITGDSIIGSFSYKLDDAKYVNGQAGCFLHIKDQQIDLKMREFTIGKYKVEKRFIDEINEGISQQNIQESFDSFNRSPREEFPFIIKSFIIQEGEIELSLTTKS